MADLLSSALIVGGLFFYVAGTVGLLRLPDTLCRLHAVTKADNLGLGLLVIGLVVQQDGLLEMLKLLSIWSLVLVASAAGGQLIARQVRQEGDDPS